MPQVLYEPSPNRSPHPHSHDIPMSDLFREVDEALTYDRLRALWKRHRIKVVATLVLALLSLAAWQAWQYSERQKNIRSAETFFDLLHKKKTQELSQQEQQNLQGGYRMLWLFARAKTFAQGHEWQKAQRDLQEIADDGALPPLYRRYAQIWHASLDIEQGRTKAAEQRLAALMEKKTIADTSALPSALQGLTLYLQATLLATQGNRQDAHDLLIRARALNNLAPVLRRRLQEAERALETTNTP